MLDGVSSVNITIIATWTYYDTMTLIMKEKAEQQTETHKPRPEWIKIFWDSFASEKVPRL